MKIKTLSAIVGLAISGVATMGTFSPANAVLFNLQYSGASFGNTATATGQIDIDTFLLNAGSVSTNMTNSLTLTISGAASGNGTFTKSDFKSFFFFSPSPLDYSKELVGQPVNGGIFGVGTSGDFNLFTDNLNAPRGVGRFTLGTFGGGGDKIRLTSFAPALSNPTQPVPESSSALGLLAIGSLGAGALLKRKQQQKATLKA